MTGILCHPQGVSVIRTLRQIAKFAASSASFGAYSLPVSPSRACPAPATARSLPFVLSPAKPLCFPNPASSQESAPLSRLSLMKEPDQSDPFSNPYR